MFMLAATLKYIKDDRIHLDHRFMKSSFVNYRINCLIYIFKERGYCGSARNWHWTQFRSALHCVVES